MPEVAHGLGHVSRRHVSWPGIFGAVPIHAGARLSRVLFPLSKPATLSKVSCARARASQNLSASYVNKQLTSHLSESADSWRLFWHFDLNDSLLDPCKQTADTLKKLYCQLSIAKVIIFGQLFVYLLILARLTRVNKQLIFLIKTLLCDSAKKSCEFFCGSNMYGFFVTFDSSRWFHIFWLTPLTVEIGLISYGLDQWIFFCTL